VTLAKFLRGLQRGNNWYNANLQSSELTDLISRYSRTDPAVVEKLPKGPAYIELNVDSVRKTAVLMKEHNLLNADIDVLDALYQKQ
jgi:hypothetical protein